MATPVEHPLRTTDLVPTSIFQENPFKAGKSEELSQGPELETSWDSFRLLLGLPHSTVLLWVLRPMSGSQARALGLRRAVGAPQPGAACCSGSSVRRWAGGGDSALGGGCPYGPLETLPRPHHHQHSLQTPNVTPTEHNNFSSVCRCFGGY